MPKVVKQPVDAVSKTIAAALRAVKAARQEAYEDTRTSSTACTDHLDAACREIEDAAKWMREYTAEVAADERPVQVKAPTKAECHACGEEVAAGDVTVCSGCNEITCPECMGDEVCKACEAEES